MSQTVADILVGTLEKIGVKHIFGLIGDSLNPLADAVRRSKIEWVGVRHEEGAALAAAGQAKLTDRLAVCAGTTGPGSTHLVAGLYEASRDHAPVLALSGDMPRKMHGTDFIQTTEPDLLFRDVSLYTETVSSPAQAPASSGDFGCLCGPWRRSPDASARCHRGKGRGRHLQHRNLETKARACSEPGGCLRNRPSDRRGRQRRHHVRRRVPGRRRRFARALRSAQGTTHSFGQGQGHHALRRSPLDGRHRHDRH